MRYSLPLLLLSCLCLWSCGPGEHVLVNETKYTITCYGWIVGSTSETVMDRLEPGQSMTIESPSYDKVNYNVCTDAGIAYFDDIEIKKATRLTVRINGNYPQLIVRNSSGAPFEVTGSLDPRPGFELTWEGEPPADKRPNADGLFSYSQFPRGMSIGELDWIIAGKYEQPGGGPRLLPLLFVGLKWQGRIYAYSQRYPDDRVKYYRGEIQLEAEPTAERLTKVLDEIYSQGFRPVFLRSVGEKTHDTVDFREADNKPEKPEDQKKALRTLLEKALTSDQDKITCILVHKDNFTYLEGPLNQYDFLCWIIRLNMPEKRMRVIDANTESWVDFASP